MSIEKALIATDPQTVLKEAAAVRAKFLLGLAAQKPDDDQSEEEPEEEIIAGPIEPSCCTANGPGLSGGTVGDSLAITVRARDADNNQIKIGGATVRGLLEGGDKTTSDVSLKIEAKDCEDGTYKLTYVPPKKGYFKVRRP